MNRPAIGTASQAARERMDAARALLARPLLTAEHPEELALVVGELGRPTDNTDDPIQRSTK